MRALPRERFVLVADDNRDLAWGLTLLLKLAGFDAKTVHDGREAVAALAERLPDIALLDIGLPGLSGFEVAERIRAKQGTQAVLVIAISGYHPDMLRANFLWSIFDHHFVKPVDFETLLPLLNKAS
jgi:DNA-binding response OmpR family regulator